MPISIINNKYLKLSDINDTLKLVIFMIADLANLMIAHQYSLIVQSTVTALLESINNKF